MSSIKEALVAGKFIEDSYHNAKYSEAVLKHLYDSIEDYGYIQKDPNPEDKVFRSSEAVEHTAIKVKADKTEEFKQLMTGLNLHLNQEELKSGEYFTFKSQNLPELKGIVRGIVKIKEKQKSLSPQAINNHFGNQK